MKNKSIKLRVQKIKRLNTPTTLHNQRGILGRLFGSSGLKIDIKSQTFTFDTIDDFKLFLAAKTEIPGSKVQEMMQRSDQHLDEEVKQLKLIEKTVNEKLAATIRDPKTIDNYLDDATMVRFSQDYDWRQIMFDLSKKSTDYSEYKLEAVTYYMKYLRSRIDVAEGIKNERNNIRKEEHAPMTETVDTQALTGDFSDHIRPAEESEDESNPLSKTGILDLSQSKEEASAESAALKRIPRGKTVKVDISGINKFPLKMSGRKFIVSIGDKIELISHKGKGYELIMGENLIGRSTQCSVILDPELVDISRQHLIIEVYPDQTLHFTDLSSSGTQLPGNIFS